MSTSSALAETVWSFRKELPEHVFDRLCVCIGPEIRVALRREQGDKPSGLFRDMLDMMAAVDEGAPEGSIGRFMGLRCFEVFDAGGHAAYVRLDPPPPWSPPVVALWAAHRTAESVPDRPERLASRHTHYDGSPR